MQTGCSVLVAVSVLVLSTMANADDELPIPAEDYIYCTVCHGVQMMGNPIIRAPRLSGMASWYVQRQMLAFKNGTRGVHQDDLTGMKMQTMAAALTNEQIAEVSSFVAATRSATPLQTVNGNIDAGRDRYATCYACHGVNGEGNEAIGGPPLAGINDWYMATQLRNYRDGYRGKDRDDNYGFLMRAATLVFLSDDESIDDVVSYIATFNNTGDRNNEQSHTNRTTAAGRRAR